VSNERLGPGGVEPRDPRELEDGGPALRVSPREHPAGPAFSVQWGWPVPDIEGPVGEEPASDTPSRARAARRDVLFGSLGVALLLLVAAAAFWTSGSSRADGTLQMLGFVFVAVAAGVVALGIYLSRAD
jgi:hypothetical protein